MKKLKDIKAHSFIKPTWDTKELFTQKFQNNILKYFVTWPV